MSNGDNSKMKSEDYIHRSMSGLYCCNNLANHSEYFIWNYEDNTIEFIHLKGVYIIDPKPFNNCPWCGRSIHEVNRLEKI